MSSLRHSVASWLLFAVGAVVCPAQSLSWFGGSDSAAKVVQLTGQVSVLKDSTPWALHVGSMVQVRQVVVTGPDGFAIFQVSDGSTFEVYPNSRVTFRANPSNLKDLLDVWLGRVKVHIEKLTGQPNNNRINTPTAIISVRGTTFDVAVEAEDSTLVSVEEGEVAVEHKLLPSGKPKLLTSGEYIRVFKDQPLAQRSPGRGAAIQHGMRAAAEAFYRIILTAPSRTPGIPGGGGGTPLPGDTGTSPPPPPPPPPPPQ